MLIVPACLFFAARFFFVYFVWESQRTEEKSVKSWGNKKVL